MRDEIPVCGDGAPNIQPINFSRFGNEKSATGCISLVPIHQFFGCAKRKCGPAIKIAGPLQK
jgi:hypothetical protein